MNNDSFKSSQNGKKPLSNPEKQASSSRPSSPPTSDASSKGYKTESLDTGRVGNEERKDSEREASQNKNRQSTNRANPSNKNEDFLKYASSNREHMIAYGLLLIGLFILLFFHSLIGGVIIGGVAGYYFSSDIVYYLRHCTQVGVGKDQVRFFILAALLLGFLIAAPGIFIGAVIVAIFTQVLANPSA